MKSRSEFPESPSALRERRKEKRREIGASMKRWEALNRYGRSVGRGLTNEELLDKVVGDTGASKTLIRSSLARKAS